MTCLGNISHFFYFVKRILTMVHENHPGEAFGHYAEAPPGLQNIICTIVSAALWSSSYLNTNHMGAIGAPHEPHLRCNMFLVRMLGAIHH